MRKRESHEQKLCWAVFSIWDYGLCSYISFLDEMKTGWSLDRKSVGFRIYSAAVFIILLQPKLGKTPHSRQNGNLVSFWFSKFNIKNMIQCKSKPKGKGFIHSVSFDFIASFIQYTSRDRKLHDMFVYSFYFTLLYLSLTLSYHDMTD